MATAAFMLLQHHTDWPTILGYSSSFKRGKQKVLFFPVMTFVYKDGQKLHDPFQFFGRNIHSRNYFFRHILQNGKHQLNAIVFIHKFLYSFHLNISKSIDSHLFIMPFKYSSNATA